MVCLTRFSDSDHTPIQCNGHQFLSSHEAWACALATVGHDAGHAGVDNSYHITVQSDLATLYSDSKPVERNASAITLRAIRKHEMLSICSAEDERRVRSIVVHVILNTSWESHSEIIESFSDFTENNSSYLNVMPSPEDRKTLCAMMSHCAQNAQLARTWASAAKWADALCLEFVSQGDKETELGLTCGPHMNRRLTNANSVALSLLDNQVLPSLRALSGFLPSVSEMTRVAEQNRTHFVARFGSKDLGGLHNQNPDAGASVPDMASAAPELMLQRRNTVQTFQHIMMPEDNTTAGRLVSKDMELGGPAKDADLNIGLSIRGSKKSGSFKAKMAFIINSGYVALRMLKSGRLQPL